jgi:G3E family GTPase
MARTAVLVNEFGEVGFDHHLLRRADEKTILLEHGCVCCTTREDLVGALLELLDDEDKGRIASLDRVVVETTGLADPTSILFTVFSHPRPPTSLLRGPRRLRCRRRKRGAPPRPATPSRPNKPRRPT